MMNIPYGCFNIMVRGNGFIGDGIFQSSVFKKLREKYPDTETRIHTYHPLSQVRELWKRNPYINYIHKTPNPASFLVHGGRFHLEINLPRQITQEFPVTIQHQAAAGITDQEVGYKVFVSKYYERIAVPYTNHLRSEARLNGKALPNIVVAVQKNWAEKSFLFTREQYERAVDVPYLGYGGAHRNTDEIVRILRNEYNLTLLTVGLDNGVVSNAPDAQSYEDKPTFLDVAEQIKACDYFIGSEGGLSNLAAGLGVKCIITTDFIAQLYWRNGVLKRVPVPQMGPCTYFPEFGHSHLSPFLTDEEVADSIYKIVSSGVPIVFDWTTEMYDHLPDS